MDTRVRLLQKYLKLSLLYNPKCTGDAAYEVMMLNDELGNFKAILEEASRKYKKNEAFQQWERKIWEALNEVEEAINSHLVESTCVSKPGTERWLRRFSSSSNKSKSPAYEVRTMREDKVKPLMLSFQRAKFSVAVQTGSAAARKTWQEITSSDAGLGFLLQNLKLLMLYHVDLIEGAQREFQQLNVDLGMLKATLEEASKKYKKDKEFEKLESRIREAVNTIEDEIDACISKATAEKPGIQNWFHVVFRTKGSKGLAELVIALRQKHLKPLMDAFKQGDHANLTVADATDTVTAVARERRLQRSPHIVGLQKETESFADLLTRESDKLEIFSVIGMAGIGKTTFAWKLFQDTTILQSHVRIWVDVTDNLNMQKVLLDILSKFPAGKQDVAGATESELITKVKGHLETIRFLIVMDDIWTVDAWKLLEALLPTNNKWGRVLITTRNIDVGNKASTSVLQAHSLKPLSAKESGELLLKYRVFGNGVPDQELESNSQIIAGDCKGLPLLIIAIGRTLEKKTSGQNIREVKNTWKEVLKSMKTLAEEDGMIQLWSIISLTYDKLPYELRNCFLYLGVFPEDADIPVKKLIRLWIAEGYIQESRETTLEEVARNNLKELINLNLVTVKKANPGGKFKICQIHVAIREMCKRESRKINLFHEIGNTEHEKEIENARRLCIHSRPLEFFERKPKLPNVRSFLSFNESTMTMKAEEVTSIVGAFGLLRVYDAKDIRFPKFSPKFVQQLYHLRYLTLAVADESFNILPEAVTDLWNLQTLMVDTPSPTLEVKGGIWKMKQLRHFETHASTFFKKTGEGEGGQKLQTLSRLSPDCANDVFKRATGLITLGIQGELSSLPTKFKRLGELDSLVRLKLVHKVSDGKQGDNQPKLDFDFPKPPNLKILVLSGTRLDWEKMSTFSEMVSLEVLKLKENAFEGNTWNAVGSGFSDLICLHIEDADLMWWTATDDHFPELQFLYINNCNKLSEIPPTLGKKLEVLSLEGVTSEAIKSARVIVEEQKKQNREVRLEVAPASLNSNNIAAGKRITKRTSSNIVYGP